MSRKLSVIIPAYNVEKYIRFCVLSVLNQTYKNIEVIVIDDGSTDNTGSILDELSQDDERLIVHHRTNHGVQESRNFGIESSTGDYLALIDADDAIEPLMYETLIDLLETNNTDISACLYTNDYDEIAIKQYGPEQIANCQTMVLRGKESVVKNLFAKDNCIQGFMWNKVYKREAVHRCRFNKSVQIVDDLYFSWEVITNNVQSASFISCPFYHYRILKSSISHKSNIDKFFNALNTVAKIVDEALHVYQTDKNRTLDFYMSWLLRVATQLSIQPIDEDNRLLLRNDVLLKIRECKKERVKFSLHNRAKMFLFVHNWRLFKCLARKKH